MAEKSCLVTGCSGYVKSRGLCDKHYQKLARRQPHLIKTHPIIMVPLVDVLDRVYIDPATKCMLWQGPIVDGIPLFEYQPGFFTPTQYAAWLHTYGSIDPRHEFLIPVCGDSVCINPSHLQLIPTSKTEPREQGFEDYRPGSSYDLAEEDVSYIRWYHKEYSRVLPLPTMLMALAKRFKVSERTIRNIIREKKL